MRNIREMTTEDVYVRLNSILDKVTESLASISEEREKQNTNFSNLIEEVESRNITITDKLNKLKNTYRKSEITLSSDITKIRQDHSILNDRITELGDKITAIEGVLEVLQKKQKETDVRALQAKKRKWWKLF
jgi:hypothetical protein